MGSLIIPSNPGSGGGGGGLLFPRTIHKQGFSNDYVYTATEDCYVDIHAYANATVCIQVNPTNTKHNPNYRPIIHCDSDGIMFYEDSTNNIVSSESVDFFSKIERMDNSAITTKAWKYCNIVTLRLTKNDELHVFTATGYSLIGIVHAYTYAPEES